MSKKFDFKDVKAKRPFRRVIPKDKIHPPIEFEDGREPAYPNDTNRYMMVSQADFMSEYYPTGHDIWNPSIYPDIFRYVEEPVTDEHGNIMYDDEGNPITNTNLYQERVPRCAFPFQQIIALTHIIHCTGNDIQKELAKPSPTDAEETLFDNMSSAWTLAGMEEAWYESFKSREITADTAFIGCLDSNNNFSYRVFSYQKGDVLFPHYDENGNTSYFARQTYQYDESDNLCAETIEIWDNTTHYIFRKNLGNNKTLVDKVKEKFGLDGYVLIYEKPHGFDFVPVAYMRDDDGPGWTPSQDGIDNYELSFSQMMHNNQAYGEAILVLKSKNETPPNISRGLSGSIKEIDLGPDDSASYLPGQSAADSYVKQIDKCEEMIYRGSSIVKSPTELKSGDTPATAIKLLFTPNVNQAKADACECRDFLRMMWKIFACAYGKKNKCIIEAQALPVTLWISPYIPISESAIAADVVSLVANKIISRETAAEVVSFYSKPGEQRKIRAEKKAEMDLDLLYEYETLVNQAKLKKTEPGDDE